MIIEFRVENFRSFHEEQTFSLVAGKDEKLPDNLIPVEKFNLLKAAAIFGANASGKSNLIKAMMFMKSFVKDSATKMNIGDKIEGITPFRLASDSPQKPSSFEMTFMIDKIRYEYGFSATRQRVHDEWLTVYPPPHYRSQGWFERRFNPETEETNWSFRNPLKSEGKMLKDRTRDNGLVLSRGAELNIEPLKQPFEWYDLGLLLLDLSQPLFIIDFWTPSRARKDPSLLNRINQMIPHADVGIDEVKIVKKMNQGKIPEIISKSSKDKFSEYLAQEYLLDTQTIHRSIDSDSPVLFDMKEDESNGTQRFFALLGPILDALDSGMSVVVDEIDASMHPLLVRKLIEMFQSPKVNAKGAQLIFATHTVTLMDPELFRRDQIFLVEKNRNGASEIFSLYDFKDKPRKTEAFQRNYLAGRYGGIPQFGPTFEDLEIK